MAKIYFPTYNISGDFVLDLRPSRQEREKMQRRERNFYCPKCGSRALEMYMTAHPHQSGNPMWCRLDETFQSGCGNIFPGTECLVVTTDEKRWGENRL